MTFHARNFIDGIWQKASSDETAPSIDPPSQTVIGALRSVKGKMLRLQ